MDERGPSLGEDLDEPERGPRSVTAAPERGPRSATTNEVGDNPTPYGSLPERSSDLDATRHGVRVRSK